MPAVASVAVVAIVEATVVIEKICVVVDAVLAERGTPMATEVANVVERSAVEAASCRQEDAVTIRTGDFPPPNTFVPI